MKKISESNNRESIGKHRKKRGARTVVKPEYVGSRPMEEVIGGASWTG